MKLNINCSHDCLQCQWQDTPTPSENKNFDWNINPKQTNPSLSTESKQQNTLLESNLKEYQVNEEGLWNRIECLEDYLEQKEQVYIKWQKELQGRLGNCCQTELKLEELLTRYKKGKASWEQRANLLDITNGELNQENESLRDELEENLKTKQEKEKQLSSLEIELDENDEILAKKNTEISKLVNNLTVAQTKTVELENELNEKEQNLNEIDSINEDKNQRIIQLAKDYRELQKLLREEKQKRQQAEQERDNYLNELNELDNDFRHQEQLLADKNAKLTQNNNLKQENNTLQGKLTYYEDQDNNLRETIQGLQNQINNHTCPLCPLIHLPEPHECPIEVNCSHSDYQQIKDQRDSCQQQLKLTQQEKEKAQQERDSYQSQLNQQEQKIIQRLNATFNLGLSSQEKDLNQAILKIQALINKPPLTITDESIKQELNQAQETITQLQNQLNQKPNTPLGESIKEIIKIDEKLLRENYNWKIELNQQSQNYQQLAEERNKSVLSQVKEISIQKLCQLIPQVKKEEAQQAFMNVNNYEELSSKKNELLRKYINQNQSALQTQAPKNNWQSSERMILISLLAVSLMGVGGLLMRLRGINKQKS